MKEVTLQTVVHVILNEWLDAGREFSAHEVTAEARTRVNSGDYDIQDLNVSYEHIPELGINGYSVKHPYVKDLINELIENGLVKASVKNGPGYKIYSNASDSIPQVVQRFIKVKKSNPFALAGGNAVQHTATVVATFANVINDAIGNKILDYVNNHAPVTVKQIQSRLKRDGNFTCDKIQEFLISKGKLNPFQRQDTASKTVVK